MSKSLQSVTFTSPELLQVVFCACLPASQTLNHNILQPYHTKRGRTIPPLAFSHSLLFKSVFAFSQVWTGSIFLPHTPLCRKQSEGVGLKHSCFFLSCYSKSSPTCSPSRSHQDKFSLGVSLTYSQYNPTCLKKCFTQASRGITRRWWGGNPTVIEWFYLLLLLNSVERTHHFLLHIELEIATCALWNMTNTSGCDRWAKEKRKKNLIWQRAALQKAPAGLQDAEKQDGTCHCETCAVHQGLIKSQPAQSHKGRGELPVVNSWHKRW